MDMALGFLRDLCGQTAAEQAAQEMEYLWNQERDLDPFCGEGLPFIL